MRTFIILPLALVSLSVASTGRPGTPSPPAVHVSGDLCTGGTASGTGLRGAYYTADPRGSSARLVRIDSRVESASLRNLPKELVNTPVRWVRWCGWIRPVASGPHSIHSAAKSMSVHIGKQLVAGPSATPGMQVNLEAGKAYSILIELPSAASAGEFSLQWTPPFGASYDIPPTVLFPPVETVKPGC